MEKIYQISNFVFYLRFLSLHPPQKLTNNIIRSRTKIQENNSINSINYQINFLHNRNTSKLS